MKSIAFFFPMVLFSTVIFAQAPDTMWTREYGGARAEKGHCVRQTIDGGYIITGYTGTFSSGIPPDIWLLKTNAAGDSMWANTFGSRDFAEHGYSVQQTSDSGYIISGGFARGLWLVKANASGDSIWARTFGTNMLDIGYSVQQTTDGGFVIAGSTTSFGSGLEDAWLIKTDALGVEQWTKTYGGSNNDRAHSVQQTTDGGYIMAGSTWSFGAGGGAADIWLIKTDTNGDSTWTKTIGTIQSDEGKSVQQTADGGYVIVGWTASRGEGGDLWLVKTDVNGDTLWTRNYGGAAFDEGTSVQQTSDGGYIIGGNWVGNDFWIVKTDAAGDSLWAITLHRNSEKCYFIRQTSDGGYIATGELTFGGPDIKLWLVKVAPGSTAIEETKQPFVSDYQLFQSYPNPFNPRTTINYRLTVGNEVRLVIYSLLGEQIRVLVDSYQEAGSHQVQWDGQDDREKFVPSGAYFYQIKTGSFTDTKKMVLLR